MLDTMGVEMQIANKSERAISLEANGQVVLTPDQDGWNGGMKLDYGNVCYCWILYAGICCHCCVSTSGGSIMCSRACGRQLPV